MKRVVVPTIVVIAILLGLFVWIFSMTGVGGFQNHATTVQVNTPVVLAGKWHQSSPPDGMSFDAQISDDSIQIMVKMDGSEGIYWLGSFDPNVIAGTIESQGDSDAMALEIFASQESFKTFTYKDGTLSFQFSMLGISQTIQLTRGVQT
jgi:hypothetical protein